MQTFLYLDKREVLQQEYSQSAILHAPHFRWVVKYGICKNSNIGHRNFLKFPLLQRSETLE